MKIDYKITEIFLYGCMISGLSIFSSLTHANLDEFLLLIFLLVVCRISYIAPNFIIRYVMFFFMCFGNLIGVFICDNTVIRLSELDLVTFHTGAFPLVVVAWYISLIVLLVLDKQYPVHFNTSSEFSFSLGNKHVVIHKYLLILLLGLLTILVLRAIEHPFYLEGIDRFEYQAKYLQGFWMKIIGWVTIMIPLALLLAWKEKNNISRIYIALYAVFLFFTGEKFGGFWNIVVFSCIIYSIYAERYNKVVLYKLLTKIFLAFSCILMVLILHRSLNYNTSLVSESQYLLQRTAQQGQLWWRTYDLEKNQGIKIYELNDEVRTFFELNDNNIKDYNHAIYKIMRYTTPEELFQNKINSGSRYSTSTLASIYYYFKEPGIIIYAILGAICYWLIMRGFMYAIYNKYLIELYIFTRLLLDYYAVMTQSEFFFIFSLKVVFFIVILTGLYLIRRYLRLRRLNDELTE